MSYHAEFRPEALDDLKDLDQFVARRILRKIKTTDWFTPTLMNLTEIGFLKKVSSVRLSATE